MINKFREKHKIGTLEGGGGAPTAEVIRRHYKRVGPSPHRFPSPVTAALHTEQRSLEREQYMLSWGGWGHRLQRSSVARAGGRGGGHIHYYVMTYIFGSARSQWSLGRLILHIHTAYHPAPQLVLFCTVAGRFPAPAILGDHSNPLPLDVRRIGSSRQPGRGRA